MIAENKIMKYLTYLGGLLMTLMMTSPHVHAKNLNQMIDQFEKQRIQKLNQEELKIAQNNPEYAYKFTLEQKNILKADVNGDKILDTIVAINFCEEVSCHITVHSNELIVYLGKKNGEFVFADHKILGLAAQVSIKPKGVIQVINYDYKDGEGMCCPTKQKIEKYKLVNGELKKI